MSFDAGMRNPTRSTLSAGEPTPLSHRWLDPNSAWILRCDAASDDCASPKLTICYAAGLQPKCVVGSALTSGDALFRRSAPPASRTSRRARTLSNPFQGNDRHPYRRAPWMPLLHLAIHLADNRRGEITLSASRTHPCRNTLEDEVLPPRMTIDGD